MFTDASRCTEHFSSAHRLEESLFAVDVFVVTEPPAAPGAAAASGRGTFPAHLRLTLNGANKPSAAETPPAVTDVGKVAFPGVGTAELRARAAHPPLGWLPPGGRPLPSAPQTPVKPPPPGAARGSRAAGTPRRAAPAAQPRGGAGESRGDGPTCRRRRRAGSRLPSRRGSGAGPEEVTSAGGGEAAGHGAARRSGGWQRRRWRRRGPCWRRGGRGRAGGGAGPGRCQPRGPLPIALWPRSSSDGSRRPT